MKSHPLYRIAQATVLTLAAFAASAQTPAPTAPVRPGMQPIGETVADRPSDVYRFETHRLDSVDGQRHYRIQIAVPKAPTSQGGSPVLYMLDGNAALDALTDADLAMLGAQAHTPVLVAVGYDVDTRVDVNARAYDYTPPLMENGQPVAAPVVRGREGGGADLFIDFFQARIKPLVHERARIDPSREMLWGHSYGGLFTLHVLFTQPDVFARYIAGDPSAWWGEGALVDEWKRFDATQAADKRVAILVGTRPRDPAQGRPVFAPAATANGADPRASVREMAEGLAAAGAVATYETFPQFGHGDMLRASLERALEIAVQP